MSTSESHLRKIRSLLMLCEVRSMTVSERPSTIRCRPKMSSVNEIQYVRLNSTLCCSRFEEFPQILTNDRNRQELF